MAVMSEIKAPWLENYGEVSFHLDYPEKSMSGVVLDTAAENADFQLSHLWAEK